MLPVVPFLGYRISTERDVGACILSMRMAFKHVSKLPENFKFIANGYSAYPLAAQQFYREFKEDFKFDITRIIGLTNGDEVTKEYYNFLRPHKHNKYKVLNDVEMLHGASNMPGKWQLLIFLGQQTILNLQNGEAANCS